MLSLDVDTFLATSEYPFEFDDVISIMRISAHLVEVCVDTAPQTKYKEQRYIFCLDISTFFTDNQSYSTLSKVPFWIFSSN